MAQRLLEDEVEQTKPQKWGIAKTNKEGEFTIGSTTTEWITSDTTMEIKDA